MFRNNSGAASLLRTRTRKARKLILSYGSVLFMIFSVFLIASLYLMRQNILSNSNTVGYEVVQRLDSSLQIEFQKQKQFVEFIAHYADVFLQDHADDPDGGRAAFDYWIKKTETELQAKQKDLRIDVYASIDGQIVSPTYWDGSAFLITEARPWYKAAMSAEPGKAAILDPYTDIFTNTVITTIAARIGNTNNVFAIDLYLESASQSSSFSYLVSDNYCFYLVDSKGTVILYYTPFNANYSQIQRYVSSFFETNVKQHISGTEEPIIDLMGDKRNVFSTYNPETGWYTIATTLYSDVLFNYHMISNLFLLMVVIFIIIEVWMVWREYHLSSQIETTNEALKVLGNSYQIILRVNFKMGTFSTLKAPDIMRIRLASRSSFDDLLTVFSDMVLPESWNNFYKNLSLNHLRNLASLSIRDYGHDYQLKLSNDNKYKWFNARILFDESLDLDESIICFKLIDEEKITEIEEHKLLADALEQAKKNEESKNVFFANMSHDMRTPLNGIIGLCQIANNHLRHNDTKNLPDVFKKMTTASHQLLALVDDILEVARPQMENKLTLEPFDIVRAVQENIDVFKVNAASQGKEVILNCDVKHSVVIGDTAKLRQILNNLVSNSLKYSHKGCVINISIREILHLNKPSFMIEVADTGIGMDKEFLAKLFAPYARELRLNSVQGTGLGMSIVKNVVTIMGGDIKVKSAVNIGTTFTINLPFRLADFETTRRIQSSYEGDFNYKQAQDKDQSKDSSDKASDSAPPPKVHSVAKPQNALSNSLSENVLNNFKLDGLNILIVEDNQLNMEIACDILGMKGVKLTSAWDGEQAVDIFTKSEDYSFDAILMDMRMPNMDGCEASSQIRASGKADAKTIPIIACTANAFTEDIAATQSAGMNAHVSKPLDFAVLEHVMGKLIATRHDLVTLVQKHKYLLGNDAHNQPAPPTKASESKAPSAPSKAQAPAPSQGQAQGQGSDTAQGSDPSTAVSSSSAQDKKQANEQAKAIAKDQAPSKAKDTANKNKDNDLLSKEQSSTHNETVSKDSQSSSYQAPRDLKSDSSQDKAHSELVYHSKSNYRQDPSLEGKLSYDPEDNNTLDDPYQSHGSSDAIAPALADADTMAEPEADAQKSSESQESVAAKLPLPSTDHAMSSGKSQSVSESESESDSSSLGKSLSDEGTHLVEPKDNSALDANTNKPPVTPISANSEAHSLSSQQGNDKGSYLGNFKPQDSGSFIKNYKASKEHQAAVEPSAAGILASAKNHDQDQNLLDQVHGHGHGHGHSQGQDYVHSQDQGQASSDQDLKEQAVKSGQTEFQEHSANQGQTQETVKSPSLEHSQAQAQGSEAGSDASSDADLGSKPVLASGQHEDLSSSLEPSEPTSAQAQAQKQADEQELDHDEATKEVENYHDDKFLKELKYSKSGLKMKIKSSTEGYNPDYSYMKEKGNYSLFKRKNKEKTDARSLLDTTAANKKK